VSEAPSEPEAGESAKAAEGASPPKRPALLFDHNVIEHLGIKLYQNKPANVLAELVANCWDADAENVWVDVQPGTAAQNAYIAVADDGTGMTLPTINERYLVIGKAKRKNPKDKSPGGRSPMGRKGIGKLAPFGIATRVDVATLADGKLNWFTLELAGLKKAGAEGRYEPDFPAEEAPGDQDPVGGDAAVRSHITTFLNKVRAKGHGTLVLMTGLTPNEFPDRAATVAGLSRRFTVILARSDFQVHVGGKKIEEVEALPEFELRIPEGAGSTLTENVDGKQVRYWAGFFEKAGPTTDEAGVGVFVHGKIAQDRPFFFRATGKEVFQRYLYAVVEADWLDELEEDLVSTDRTSIDWDDPPLPPGARTRCRNGWMPTPSTAAASTREKPAQRRSGCGRPSRSRSSPTRKTPPSRTSSRKPRATSPSHRSRRPARICSSR